MGLGQMKINRMTLVRERYNMRGDWLKRVVLKESSDGESRENLQMSCRKEKTVPPVRHCTVAKLL